jgi:hypothetical protein
MYFNLRSSEQRLIAKDKQRSHRLVIGWVTKIYYLELLRASEGTLSRWLRLHLQLLASAIVSYSRLRNQRSRLQIHTIHTIF